MQNGRLERIGATIGENLQSSGLLVCASDRRLQFDGKRHFEVVPRCGVKVSVGFVFELKEEAVSSRQAYYGLGRFGMGYQWNGLVKRRRGLFFFCVRLAAEGKYKRSSRVKEWQESPRGGVSSWDGRAVDAQSGVRKTVAAVQVRTAVHILPFGSIGVAMAVGGRGWQ